MVIQAFGTDHPVLAALKGDCSDYGRQMLDQRKLFGFPPYVRMIQLTVRNASAEDLRRTCSQLSSDLKRAGVKDVSDPIVPAVDRIAGLYIRHIWIKLPRTTAAQTKKASIAAAVDRIRQLTPSSDIIIDVDPL